MRSIFTFSFITIAFLGAYLNSFGQTCTQTTENFNTATTTQGFTGTRTSGTGTFTALALSNNTLNLFTILGLIMLIGLVAKNAIILVDFTNQRKAEGASTYDALIDANHARLRPILMTTIAMVIGMLPIALASGAGAEWKNGLAWVIIGGLISSLFLTLVVVPVMYAIFDKLINKFSKKKPLAVEDMMQASYKPLKIHEEEVDPSHI